MLNFILLSGRSKDLGVSVEYRISGGKLNSKVRKILSWKTNSFSLNDVDKTIFSPMPGTWSVLTTSNVFI